MKKPMGRTEAEVGEICLMQHTLFLPNIVPSTKRELEAERRRRRRRIQTAGEVGRVCDQGDFVKDMIVITLIELLRPSASTLERSSRMATGGGMVETGSGVRSYRIASHRSASLATDWFEV